MFDLKGFGYFVLATTTVATVTAETHCPGNVANVPYHLVNRYEMVVEVSVNHGGPYDFLLDTGAQRTLLDSALAADLHLATAGEAEVAGPGFNRSASFAQTQVVEAATHAVAGLKVLVYDLGYLRSWGMNVRGVLGEDFLERFDMLIENTHHLLCLDGSGAMRAYVKGPHIPLLAPSKATDGGLPEPPNPCRASVRRDAASSPGARLGHQHTLPLQPIEVHVAAILGGQLSTNGGRWANGLYCAPTSSRGGSLDYAQS